MVNSYVQETELFVLFELSFILKPGVLGSDPSTLILLTFSSFMFFFEQFNFQSKKSYLIEHTLC